MTPTAIDATPTVAESLLKLPAVMAQTGLGRTRIYMLMREGRFPRPIKVGATSLWVASEVNAWVLDTITAAREPKKKTASAVRPERVIKSA